MLVFEENSKEELCFPSEEELKDIDYYPSLTFAAIFSDFKVNQCLMMDILSTLRRNTYMVCVVYGDDLGTRPEVDMPAMFTVLKETK